MDILRLMQFYLLCFILLIIKIECSDKNIEHNNLNETLNQDLTGTNTLNQMRNLQNENKTIKIWDLGYYRDTDSETGCVKCEDDQYWPFGTQTAFKISDRDSFGMDTLNFSLISPAENIISGCPTNHTRFIILFSIIIFFVIYFTIRIIGFLFSEEKCKKFITKLDLLIITGGAKKSSFGGISTLALFLITLMCFAAIVSYFLTVPCTFSEWTDILKRMENKRLEKDFISSENSTLIDYKYSASYMLYVVLYTSRFVDSDETQRHYNLWEQDVLQLKTSNYFKDAEIESNCLPIPLQNQKEDYLKGILPKKGFHKYVYSIHFKNVPRMPDILRREWIEFKLNTDSKQIYHFFDLELVPVWDYSNVLQDTSYQFSRFSTKTPITSYYAGSEPIVLKKKLHTIQYENYARVDNSMLRAEAVTTSGYKISHYEEFFGSSDRDRKSALPNTNNSGLSIQIQLDQSTDAYRYRVSVLLDTSDSLLYIAALVAFWVVLIRVSKKWSIQ